MSEQDETPQDEVPHVEAHAGLASAAAVVPEPPATAGEDAAGEDEG